MHLDGGRAGRADVVAEAQTGVRRQPSTVQGVVQTGEAHHGIAAQRYQRDAHARGGAERHRGRRLQHGHREVRRRKARGHAARRQASQDREVAERVVERTGGPGEHHFAGAATQRLVHGELAVGDVLAHRVADQLHAVVLQAPDAGLVERVEVADDRVRPHAETGEEPGAAVGGQHEVGAGDEGAVPAGVAVVAVEEHDGESATPVLRAPGAHAPIRLASGNAAS